MKGRKGLIEEKGCLALSLAWTKTRGSDLAFQMTFGMTATPICMHLRSQILRKTLCRNPAVMLLNQGIHF